MSEAKDQGTANGSIKSWGRLGGGPTCINVDVPLPRQLQRELQLARIKCRRPFLAAVPQRIYVCDVKTIDEVEGIDNTFQGKALAEGNSS